MAKNYYDILGVDKKASKEEVKKAFRVLAHKHHPDKTGGSADKFKEVNEAYSVLSDDKKRAEYDTYGRVSEGGGGAGGNGGQGFEGFDFSNFSDFGEGSSFDLGDIFGDIFGGGRQRQKRGQDISVDIELDFKESIFGVNKKIVLNKTSVCDHCKGSGGEVGTSFATCSTCNGSGLIRETRRSFMGAFSQTKTCDTCKGKGKVPREKCKKCKGTGITYGQQEINVQIPSGIESGEMLKVPGYGEAETSGVPGDLYVKIHVKKHPKIVKEGHNLIMDLNLKLSDALLGAEYDVETLDGNLKVKIPEGINFGEMLRLKGKGVPMGTAHRGDLFLKIKINIPKKLSKDTRKTIEELRKEGL